MISAYIALRFEWKYAVPVLIALMHDLLITAGVYSLTGREVTTATVAALLTILGYSLYDTIIVFDRVRENVPRMPRAAFSQIVNRSMSEVLTRSLATSFCTLLPVHRAAAVRRGNAEGLRLRADGRHRLGRLLLDLHRLAGADPLEGARGRLPLPPRADRGRTRQRARLRDDRSAARPRTSSPSRRANAPGAGSLIAPEEPGEQISRDEFQELVRDLDVEGEPKPKQRPPARSRRGRRSSPEAASRRRSAPESEDPPEAARDPAADLTPEDLVLKEEPKAASAQNAPRNKRHGRSR